MFSCISSTNILDITFHIHIFVIYSLPDSHTQNFTFLDISFYNYVFIIHSIPNAKIYYFTLRYSFYISKIFIIHSLYIQFQILIDKLSQLDICYTFSFPFLNITLYKYIFVIHSVRHSNIDSNKFNFHYTLVIHSLYIRYRFSFKFLYIKFRN